MSRNCYDEMKKYSVDATGIKDFAGRYCRGSRMTDHTLENMQADIDRDGFTFLSHHESNTGDIVSYYPEVK